MAFFEGVDRYELKQLGLDDGELDTMEKVLSRIPRPIRALIKDDLIKELKQAIKDEGVKAIKDAIQILKDELDANPGLVKGFEDMFKAGMPFASPTASSILAYIRSFQARTANPGISDVCKACRDYGADTPEVCRNCPLAHDPNYDDTMDHADLCTPAHLRHMRENLPRRR